MNELALLREELEKSMLTTMKSVRALTQSYTDLTGRISTLEEQMRKRIYVSPAHKNIVQKAVNNKVRALTEKYCIDYKVGAKRLFQAIWRALKDKYSISVYGELPDIEFDTALDFIRTWEDEVFLNRIKEDTAA
jgi:hypothetical protein